LMLRDRERAVPIGDIIAWMRGDESLPSGADRRAADWLAAQP